MVSWPARGTTPWDTPLKAYLDGSFASKAATEAALARVDPGTAGSANQFLVYDSDESRMGWFDQPVLVSNWAPYKAENDGVTATHTRLQSFIDAVSTMKIAGVVLPGTYRTEAELYAGSNTHLLMHGATILHKSPGLTAAAINVDNVEHVRIDGATIDGDWKNFVGATQTRYGIRIRSSSHVTITNYHGYGHKGDALQITYHGNAHDAPSTHITVRDSVFEENYRLGASVICADGVLFDHVAFDNNGHDADASANPRSGLDLEPNYADNILRNVTVFACTANDNERNGFITSGPDSPTGERRGIRFISCEARRNTASDSGAGFGLNSAEDVVLENCRSLDNRDGVTVTARATNIRIHGGEYRDNNRTGINFSPGAYPQDRLVIDGADCSNNAVSDSSGRGVVFNAGSYGKAAIRHIRAWGHLYNVAFSGGPTFDRFELTDNDLETFTGRAFYFTGTPWTDVLIRDNAGYTNHAKGIASVADGGTIAHGLGTGASNITPTWYTVAATAAGHNARVTSVSATTLTVSLTDDTGAAVMAAEPVAWQAEAYR